MHVYMLPVFFKAKAECFCSAFFFCYDLSVASVICVSFFYKRKKKNATTINCNCKVKGCIARKHDKHHVPDSAGPCHFRPLKHELKIIVVYEFLIVCKICIMLVMVIFLLIRAKFIVLQFAYKPDIRRQES